MYSRSSEPVRFERDCPVVLVPSGEAVTMPAGSIGYITQALGGSFTVFVEGNLMRVAGKDADAIGKEPPTPIELPEGATDEDVEKLVWQQLRTCFDPEIPINVVDLGLVYGIHLDEDNNCTVDMTLTSPTCPLTDRLEFDTEMALDGLVNSVVINWVWLPPWTLENITDDGREQLRAIGYNV